MKNRELKINKFLYPLLLIYLISAFLPYFSNNGIVNFGTIILSFVPSRVVSQVTFIIFVGLCIVFPIVNQKSKKIAKVIAFILLLAMVELATIIFIPMMQGPFSLYWKLWGLNFGIGFWATTLLSLLIVLTTFFIAFHKK